MAKEESEKQLVTDEERSRVVRDNVSMPPADHALFASLQARALRLRVAVNKSEVARAGLKALAEMSDKKFLKALGRVEKVKPGRP